RRALETRRPCSTSTDRFRESTSHSGPAMTSFRIQKESGRWRRDVEAAEWHLPSNRSDPSWPRPVGAQRKHVRATERTTVQLPCNAEVASDWPSAMLEATWRPTVT